MSAIKNIQAHKSFVIPLVVTLMFFIVKGIQYAVIGSYVPIAFILVIAFVLYISYKTSAKAFRRMLRFWVFLIILWSVARLFFWVYLEIDTKLTESHLREQFGVFQNILTLGMLVSGILLLKSIKTIQR